MSDDVRPNDNRPEIDGPENDAAEAEEATAAAASDTLEQASDGDSEPIVDDADATGLPTPEEEEEIEAIAEPELPGKLERLQKILAQAGIASRRHAENLITEGRVQVNGKVITELGTKADAARDHIRVDGKLLQGSERLRYFMLNKPRGFVTTVSDPEKRPTVMEFFAKLRERLYPVGRLDYLSEGLLLVTNDGELANKLTKAASGVQKTYLVKVSGEPSEEALDRLRSGIGIERGKPGSGKVQTAPAQIRKVRQGDNPWYEVVIIEGRNRELRKMFEEIGHHVEKIRRVGYGPLVLDIEPGKMRELEAEELEDLRKAADGKLKPKLKDIRRKKAMDAQLPTVKPTLRRTQAFTPSAEQPSAPRRDFPPKKQFGSDRPTGEGFRPKPDFAKRSPARFASQRSDSPRSGPPRSGPAHSGPPQFSPSRPAWKKDDRTARPPARFGERPPHSERPAPSFGSRSARPDRPAGGFAGKQRPDTGRPFEKRPWKKPDADRPAFKPHGSPRREADSASEDIKPPRPSKLQIEAVEPEHDSTSRSTSSRPPTGRAPVGRTPFRGAASDRPAAGHAPAGRAGQGRPGQFRPRPDRPRSDRRELDRPGQDRPRPDRSAAGRPRLDRPNFDRPSFDRPKFDRSSSTRPASGPGRSSDREFGSGRPPRPAGDRSRPFTTSSGKPRAGGARPSNKRAAAASPGKPAWKSKAGNTGRAASAGRPKPAFGARPGGFSKSGPGFKGKPGGARKPAGGRSSGPRPSGPRSSGKPGGKKRG